MNYNRPNIQAEEHRTMKYGECKLTDAENKRVMKFLWQHEGKLLKKKLEKLQGTNLKRRGIC